LAFNLIENEHIAHHGRLFGTVRNPAQFPEVHVIGIAIKADKQIDDQIWQGSVAEEAVQWLPL
jgi:hypothetical protein